MIDTGSNVSSFIDPRPLQLTPSNGKQMKIKPHGEILPLSEYNVLTERNQRIDGIIGQDVLSKFRSINIDYHLGEKLALA